MYSIEDKLGTKLIKENNKILGINISFYESRILLLRNGYIRHGSNIIYINSEKQILEEIKQEEFICH